jgi:hypothetical protein
MNYPPPNDTAVLVGVSCFKRELRNGLEAGTADNLSTGVDACASVRTVPALRKAVFLGTLMAISLLRTAWTPRFLTFIEALKSALHSNPQSWQMNLDCDTRLSL